MDPSSLITTIAAVYGVTVADITGRGRPQRVAEARQAVYLLLHEQGMSYSRIGRIMERDHGAVSSGIQHLRELAEVDHAAHNRIHTARQRILTPATMIA